MLRAIVRALLRESSTEPELRRAVDCWQAAFDAIPVGLCVLGIDGTTERCNPAMARLVAKDPARIVGRGWRELVPGSIVRGPDDPFAEMRRTNGAASAELTDGRAWYALHLYPVAGRGGVSGAVLSLADVTADKKLQSQLMEAQRLEAVGHLAAGIAHQFNNLLTAILGYTDRIRSQVAPPSPLLADLDAIVESSDRAATLVRQLLAFGRKQTLRPRPVDLREVLAHARPTLRSLLPERIELQVAPAPASIWVMADPDEIERSLLQLAIRARDAIPVGSRVTIEAVEVSLTAQDVAPYEGIAPGRFGAVRVTDTAGDGDAGHLARIFDPFVSPAGLAAADLGLAAVYGGMRQSGGFATVDHLPHQGSTFSLYLPIAAAQPPPT